MAHTTPKGSKPEGNYEKEEKARDDKMQKKLDDDAEKLAKEVAEIF